MLWKRTLRRPSTGDLKMLVRTSPARYGTLRGSLTLTERILGKRGIGSFPGDIGSWAINGYNRLIEQTQVDGELRTVVRGVENAAPENPDAFAFDIEKTVRGEPPCA